MEAHFTKLFENKISWLLGILVFVGGIVSYVAALQQRVAVLELKVSTQETQLREYQLATSTNFAELQGLSQDIRERIIRLETTLQTK